MRRPLSILLTPFAVLIVSLTCTDSWGQEKQPLRLVQTIPLQNVKGRIDHMDVDVKGRRLFVAGLEHGSVEVVDLRAGKWLKSIPGFQKSHGIAYVESLNKVFVASGDDGMLRAFRGDTLDLLDSIKLNLAPNRVIYDPHTKLLYVGYGGIGTRTPSRMIAMNSKSGKEVSALSTTQGMNGVYFDAKHKRVYVSGGREQGEGFVFVYEQEDADHYETIGQITTRPGADLRSGRLN